MAPIAPPKGLGTRARKLWADTTSKYDLRADELSILEDACREVDLIDKMSEILAGVSLVTEGSMGQTVAHPLVSEVRQHRATLASLLRALKLPDDGGQVNQQRSAGQSSWASRRGA